MSALFKMDNAFKIDVAYELINTIRHYRDTATTTKDGERRYIRINGANVIEVCFMGGEFPTVGVAFGIKNSKQDTFKPVVMSELKYLVRGKFITDWSVDYVNRLWARFFMGVI